VSTAGRHLEHRCPPGRRVLMGTGAIAGHAAPEGRSEAPGLDEHADRLSRRRSPALGRRISTLTVVNSAASYDEVTLLMLLSDPLRGLWRCHDAVNGSPYCDEPELFPRDGSAG